MSKIITLLHSGGVTFNVDDLIDYIRNSGRTHIIQGAQNASLEVQLKRKPSSLDVWLRQFARNKNTMQATNEAIEKLVKTGLFREGKFKCPDSTHSRLLKGIELVSQ